MKCDFDDSTLEFQSEGSAFLLCPSCKSEYRIVLTRRFTEMATVE